MLSVIELTVEQTAPYWCKLLAAPQGSTWGSLGEAGWQWNCANELFEYIEDHSWWTQISEVQVIKKYEIMESF